MDATLYPEIIQAGSLEVALNNEFAQIGSTLRLSVKDPSLSYVMLKKGSRFSQVYLASKTKLYLPDYWREGVYLGVGEMNNIHVLAQSLDYWLCSLCTAVELAAKFELIRLQKYAVAFDEGREIEYTWNSLFHDPDRSDIRTFIALAMEDNIVKGLFPFTSHARLCFSRCTGYPYTTDTPIVTPLGQNLYEVRSCAYRVIGTGMAEDALQLVKANLPVNIKRAVKGTADDL